MPHSPIANYINEAVSQSVNFGEKNPVAVSNRNTRKEAYARNNVWNALTGCPFAQLYQ